MRRRGFFIIGFIAAILLLINPPAGWSQAEDAQEGRLEERLEEKKGMVATTTEELIELLKRRALRKVEEGRREQLRKTKGTIGLHVGYDNNVNTNSDRRGDIYCEQYFSYSWIPTFHDELGAEVGIWYFGDWYFDNDDTTLTDAAFNASLKWYPTAEPTLVLQPGVEWTYPYYPYSDPSSYTENKAFLKFKYQTPRRWIHSCKYEHSYKGYDTRGTRRGPTSGTYIDAMRLEKKRDTFAYDLTFPRFGKNNFKLKLKEYKETSNDAFIEYYDLYSHKVTAEIGRSIMKKLYAKLSSAYERKNYCRRMITTHQTAQYDDICTQKLNLYYALKRNWTLSYTLTHKTSDSNYTVYDYDSLNHLAGIYISF